MGTARHPKTSREHDSVVGVLKFFSLVGSSLSFSNWKIIPSKLKIVSYDGSSFSPPSIDHFQLINLEATSTDSSSFHLPDASRAPYISILSFQFHSVFDSFLSVSWRFNPILAISSYGANWSCTNSNTSSLSKPPNPPIKASPSAGPTAPSSRSAVCFFSVTLFAQEMREKDKES